MSPPAARNPAVLLLGLAAAALIGLGLFLLARRDVAPPPPPAPLREVSRTDLTRTNDRLQVPGESQAFTGWMLDRYPDGTLRSKSAVSNGLLQGVSEGWHTNGTIQIREFFVDGVSHGLRTKWSPEGTRISEATVEHGKIQGMFRRWHTNGSLAEEVSMKDDQPDGVAQAFHPDGTLKTRVTLRNGTVVKQDAAP